MSVEALLIDLLTNSPDAAALVAGRLYLGQAPEDTALPAIVFNLVSDVPQPNLADRASNRRMQARVQVNPLATTAAGVKSAHDAVQSALDRRRAQGIAGVDLIEIRRDLAGPYSWDTQLNVWTRPVDYLIQYYV